MYLQRLAIAVAEKCDRKKGFNYDIGPLSHDIGFIDGTLRKMSPHWKTSRICM
jgi:hypothetical protein